MANPTVPELSPLAQRKLERLMANGYQITGVCFERKIDGNVPHRGFIDSWGFVGWQGEQEEKSNAD